MKTLTQHTSVSTSSLLSWSFAFCKFAGDHKIDQQSVLQGFTVNMSVCVCACMTPLRSSSCSFILVAEPHLDSAYQFST